MICKLQSVCNTSIWSANCQTDLTALHQPSPNQKNNPNHKSNLETNPDPKNPTDPNPKRKAKKKEKNDVTSV